MPCGTNLPYVTNLSYGTNAADRHKCHPAFLVVSCRTAKL
jgi:hypothetical protein